jgi:hypothetical protein
MLNVAFRHSLEIIISAQNRKTDLTAPTVPAENGADEDAPTRCFADLIDLGACG